MKIGIKSWYSGGILFSIETETVRLALEAAVKSGADLRGADLRGATGWREAIAPLLVGVPVVPDLHTQMVDAFDAQRLVLDMPNWHGSNSEQTACGTTHCRAGTAIHLAGPEGYALEKRTSPAMAGLLITIASCPWLETMPNFYCGNIKAMADIRECARREQELAAQEKTS